MTLNELYRLAQKQSQEAITNKQEATENNLERSVPNLNEEKDPEITLKNNLVEIYSDKKIENHDLEYICLFFQIPSQSGGDRIKTKKLDYSKHVLTIEYEKSISKKTVLEKRNFTVSKESENFNLVASDPIDDPCFLTSNQMIIWV